MIRTVFFLFALLSPFISIAQFGPANDISNGLKWGGMLQVVDLDNDGKDDIVTLAQGACTVTWMKNIGNNNFGLSRSISEKYEGVSSFDTGDIDADGDLDLVISFFSDELIITVENVGSGFFTNEQIIENAGEDVTGCKFADLDGDADLDIVAVYRGTKKANWYENISAGNYSSGVNLDVSTGALKEGLAVADLDSDGDTDVITTDESGNELTWFENLGNNMFSSEITIASGLPVSKIKSVFPCDLDGDGDLDLLTANAQNDKISWFENLGAATFSTVKDISSNADFASSAHAIDLDGDNDLDVLSASVYDGKVAWYENLGSGNFTEHALPIFFESAVFVLGADVDGDGDNDILSTSEYNSKLMYFENLGSGNFAGYVELISSTNGNTSVGSADFDGDGLLDVFSSSIYDGNISWFKNLGGGQFGKQRYVTSYSPYEIQDACAADLDNDGDQDIVACFYDNSRIRWYENDGSGAFGSGIVISSSISTPNSLYCKDADNDGDIDVFATSFGGDRINVYFNNNNATSWGSLLVSNLPNGPYDVFVEDIDGDGDQDVLSASYYDDKVLWYENLGGFYHSGRLIDSSSTSGRISVFAADIDHDGDADVFSGSDWTIATWYENLNGGTFGPAQSIASSWDAFDFDADDLDGDGDLDLVLGWGGQNGGVSWYENLGNGNFNVPSIIESSLGHVRNTILSDVDNDGDRDVIYAESGGKSRVIWHENYFKSPYQFSGSVYYDANQNAQKDAVEMGLGLVTVDVTPSAKAAYSYENGNYILAVDSGYHQLSYNIGNNYWNLTTDSSTYNRRLGINNSTTDSLDFGFFPDTVVTDLSASLTGGFPRCNQNVNYWISLRNSGTTTPNCVLKLELDTAITFVNSSVPLDSTVDNCYYWHIDSIFFNTEHQITLEVIMPPFTSIGDTLHSVLFVNALDSGGNTIFSDQEILQQLSVCAYDPNDKQVLPRGIGSNGVISLGQNLQYTVRFQNTGNDTAFTVMLRDQLDSDLDWNSLEITGSSHSYVSEIQSDGELVVTFNNIMLPDSNSDKLGSQGFLKFKIDQNPLLAPKTPIANSVQIFFDANPPITTNTVVNTIECYHMQTPIIKYSFPRLFVTGVLNYNIQWYLNDSILFGANSDSIIPTQSGVYTVIISDSILCRKESSPFQYAVGIAEKEEMLGLAYPNPTNGSTTIITSVLLNDDHELIIYNSLGMEVSRYSNLTGNKVIVSGNEFPSGLYFASILDKRKQHREFTVRIVFK